MEEVFNRIEETATAEFRFSIEYKNKLQDFLKSFVMNLLSEPDINPKTVSTAVHLWADTLQEMRTATKKEDFKLLHDKVLQEKLTKRNNKPLHALSDVPKDTYQFSLYHLILFLYAGLISKYHISQNLIDKVSRKTGLTIEEMEEFYTDYLDKKETN